MFDLNFFLLFKPETAVAVEIRTFDRDAEQLSEFIVSTWLKSYEGKMSVPDWSPDYFDWQMTGTDFADRDYLVTAWQGTQLVGTLLAMPFPLWINGQQVEGAHGSWLAVDPDVRREGVASKLASEVNRKQKERNCYGRLGYAFQGSKKSQGPRFWKAGHTKTKFVRKMYLWARVLNPSAVRAWSNKPLEKLMLGILPQAAYRIPKPAADSSVRDYTPADLKVCLELINNQAKKTDLAVLWTETRLAQQLFFEGLAETKVIERGGQVVGFLNFHLLGLFLKGRITSSIIDLFACDQLSAQETTSLLAVAMRHMQELGTDLILMREFAAQPRLGLLKMRFMPQFADSTLMLNRSDENKENLLVQNKKMQILWR